MQVNRMKYVGVIYYLAYTLTIEFLEEGLWGV